MKQIFNKAVTLAVSTLSLVAFNAVAEYQLPQYEKYKLNNGLTVYLMEQHEVPLIDVNLVIKSGAVNDGKHAGVNYVTANSLMLGTQSLSKSELENKLDFIGADVSSHSNLEFTQVSASYAAKDNDLMLPLLHDVLLKPGFDKKEFGKYQTRLALQLEQQKESPRAVINTYFNRMIFGEQGFGASVSGNKDTVNALTVDNIKQHYDNWYHPNNAAIVVAGDFNAKDMKKQLNKLFGGWKRNNNLPNTRLTAQKKPDSANVLLVNKSDAIETTFLIGGKGVAKSNPDQVGISVINTILGGRFTSWLNDELRVNAGLTYGARSSFRSYSQDGTFAISTFTKTETTTDAVDLALKTYARLWEKGIDTDTLSSAKAYVKGKLPPRFETSTQLAGLLVDMYGYGFDESYINTFEEQVNSLDVAKTKALIKQYFPKDKLQFVMIGKADDIRDKVKQYGKVTELNIADTGFGK